MIATNAEQSWIELKETYMGDLCTYCLWKHALKLTCPAKAWSMLPVIPVLAVSHDCYEFNMWLVSLRSNFSSQTALQCYIDIMAELDTYDTEAGRWEAMELFYEQSQSPTSVTPCLSVVLMFNSSTFPRCGPEYVWHYMLSSRPHKLLEDII